MSDYYYVIDQDDDDLFLAELRKDHQYGDSIYDIEGMHLVEDGYMKHKFDVKGLHTLLALHGVINLEDQVHLIN